MVRLNVCIELGDMSSPQHDNSHRHTLFKTNSIKRPLKIYFSFTNSLTYSQGGRGERDNLPLIKPLNDRIPLLLLHSNQVIWLSCLETKGIHNDDVTMNN